MSLYVWVPGWRKRPDAVRPSRQPNAMMRLRHQDGASAPTQHPHSPRPYVGWEAQHGFTMSVETVYGMKVIERVEVFMFNTAIRSASVLVYCFSGASIGVGEDNRLNNRTKIKRRCTDENITQEASAFG